MKTSVEKFESAMGLHPRACALCGKKFEARVGYRYKIRKGPKSSLCNFYCSYSCFREAQKERENDKQRAV